MMNNSTTSKQKLLHALYDQAAEIYADTKWSCKKGCSSCCTQSVTITTLEGRVILEYLQGREDNERFFPALQKALTRRHRRKLRPTPWQDPVSRGMNWSNSRKIAGILRPVFFLKITVAPSIRRVPLHVVVFCPSNLARNSVMLWSSRKQLQ